MFTKISSWFSQVQIACPICGRSNNRSANDPAAIPIRRPEPRRIISSLCGSCRQAIPWISRPVCRICGRAERCEDCVRRKTRHYFISRCAVRYDNLMRDWLAVYKYRGNEKLESVLAAILAFGFERLCEAAGLGNNAGLINNTRSSYKAQPMFHAITSVPLAPERLQDRGFNQAERLALQLSRWYGLSYSPMLIRLRHTEKQSLKTRRSRVVDMRGNFSAVSTDLFSRNAIISTESTVSTVSTTSATSMISTMSTESTESTAARIIIVDDIYTTGSTLDECARVLREAANQTIVPEIYGLLWARS